MEVQKQYDNRITNDNNDNNDKNYETWGAKTIANFTNYNTCEPEILWAFRIIGETFCIKEENFKIFKRS